MKYYVTVGNVTYEIVIDRQGQLTIDGQELEVDIQPSGRLDLYSLLVDHVSHEVVVEPNSEARYVYDVFVAGTRYEVTVQDERTRRLSLVDRSLGTPTGELAVKAPIPGLVVRVLIEPGQQVQRGQPLIILEAMKMENELCAPRDGSVHDLRVQAGAHVSQGQVLLTLR